MHYMNCEGVKCTPSGFPICSTDEKCCDVEGCRYFIVASTIGNCVLRVMPDDKREPSMEKISVSFGMHGKKVSRQRIDQIEKRALRKLRERWGAELREARNR